MFGQGYRVDKADVPPSARMVKGIGNSFVTLEPWWKITTMNGDSALKKKRLPGADTLLAFNFLNGCGGQI